MISVLPELLKCKVLTGSATTNKITYLPRCRFNYGKNKNELGVHFNRLQFPIRPSFAMSINKAQGQTLGRVGIALCLQEVFSHGQLYTAFSRVRKMEFIRVLTSFLDDHCDLVKNIVFPEILDH